MKAEPQIIRKHHKEVPRRAAQPVSAWTIAVVLLPASAFIVWALWRAWH